MLFPVPNADSPDKGRMPGSTPMNKLHSGSASSSRKAKAKQALPKGSTGFTNTQFPPLFQGTPHFPLTSQVTLVFAQVSQTSPPFFAAIIPQQRQNTKEVQPSPLFIFSLT